VEASIPVTYHRAKTAIVQCHSHLLQARLAARTAIVILERLDDPEAPWPQDARERRKLLDRYREFVASLEVAERTLVRAWKGDVLPDGEVHEEMLGILRGGD
jgi:hypothetical protein